jgi:hypothetical protein
MALPQYPDALQLREAVRAPLTVILNGAARLREQQQRRIAANLLPLVDAVLECAELLKSYEDRLTRRHFETMMAATTQPTTRTFSGEPMLGAALVRRVAAARTPGSRKPRAAGAGKQRAAGRPRRRTPVPV